MEFADLYDHEVMVANIEDLPPEEVWRWYNKRANGENTIDELKTGLGLDRNSQQAMLKNKAFM
ncbi:MAG: transposase [Eubacteriales bacterium]|nr:transposase [Bacillota bacterium]MBV1728249.1 transposase [Desulforudis sp.]MDP3050719.1 transposase [Eubacteriales bacterium]MDQ7788903.1 transposase [Clostridia bacterium]MBU4533550.1 transposase [Bacillota bacterium]